MFGIPLQPEWDQNKFIFMMTKPHRFSVFVIDVVIGILSYLSYSWK